MSNDPYLQGQLDARAGRSLTPGADETAYLIERQNQAEIARRAAEQVAQQKATAASSPIDTWLPAPPPSRPVSPEEASAGLTGCAMTLVVVALAPVYFALYPMVAIASIAAAGFTFQVIFSGEGGTFVGLGVVAVFFIAAAVASRAEHALARSAIYRLVRLPFRALGLSLLVLTLLSKAGFGLGCSRPVGFDSVDQLLSFLGTYYGCLLAQPKVLGVVLGAIALIVVAGRSSALRKRWHRALRALHLHG
jgi:hypothetical protein